MLDMSCESSAQQMIHMEYQVYFSLKIQHCRLLQSVLAPKGLIMQICNRLHVPFVFGRTHGAPYRGYGYVPLRFGGGGGRRKLGEWEHNKVCPKFLTTVKLETLGDRSEKLCRLRSQC